MRYAGEVAALLTALCWTISTISFSSAGRRVGSLSVNFIRLVLACLLLAAYGLLVRGLAFPSDASLSAWFWLSLSGFVGFFLGDLALFKAFVLLGPRLSLLLMSLAPPIAAGVAYFALGERLILTNWLGMIVTLLGVSWVVIERRTVENGEGGLRSHVSFRGVILGVLAAAGQGVGLVFSKLGMGENDYDPFASTQIRLFPAVAGLAILLGCIHWYPRIFETLKKPRVMGMILLGALLGPCLGVSLLLLSVQYISVGVAQTIVAIMPVLVIPFVIVLYKERVSWRAFLGACVAVLGVAMLFNK